MLKQIYTWKIVCNQCSRAEVYNVEQPDEGFFSGARSNIPEGWGRIENPPPEAEPGNRPRRTSSFGSASYFSSQDMFYVPTYREYCPACYGLVIKAEAEKKARAQHAEKYL